MAKKQNSSEVDGQCINTDNAADEIHLHRRTLLKGASATVLTGLGTESVRSLQSGSNGGVAFFMGLYVPTIVNDDATPVPAARLGETQRGPREAAIMLPDATHRHDEDFPWEDDPWWVGRELGHDYSLRIPATVVWNSSVEPGEFGKVVFRPEDPSLSLNPEFHPDANHNGVVITNQPRGMRTVYLTPKYQDVSDVPAVTYFREGGLTLSVEFRGGSRLSEVAPSNPFESTVQYVTPNKSVLGANKVLSEAETTYDNGIKIANRVTALPKKSAGVLRIAGRLAAYTQAQRSGWADEITESDLVNKTALEGLSAFKDVVRDAADVSDYLTADLSLAPTGPAVAFQSKQEDGNGSDQGDSGDSDQGSGDDSGVSDLSRFDFNNNGRIDEREVLRAIHALNNNEKIGGKPVSIETVQKLIAAHNSGQRIG